MWGRGHRGCSEDGFETSDGQVWSYRGHWGELLQPRPCHLGLDQDKECEQDDAPGGLPQLGGGVGWGGQGVEGGGRPVGRTYQRLGEQLLFMFIS